MDGLRSDSMFCVVDFVGGRKRTVVPDTWLSVNETHCLLPPKVSDSDLEVLVRNSVEPGQGWQMLEVDSLETFGSFSEAKRQLGKSKETSDAGSQRKRKKPSYLEDYATHDSDDGRKPFTVFGVDFDEEAMSENEWVPPPEFTPRIENVSTVKKSIRNDSRPRNPRFSQIQSRLSSQKENIDITCDCQSTCHSTFLRALHCMQKQLDRTNQMVQQLLGGQKQTHSQLKRVLQSQPVNQINNSQEEMEAFSQDSTNFVQCVLQNPSTSGAQIRTEDSTSFSEAGDTYITADQPSTSEKKNIDKKGIKRGNCMAENCDCELFEYDEKFGSNCSYCSCPPTKHKKIDASEETREENCAVISNFKNDDIQAKDSMDDNAVLISTSENDGIQAKDTTEENYVLISTVENDGIQTKAGYTFQNLIPISPGVDVFPTSSSLQDLLPRKLPRAVQEAMDKKALTPQIRSKIVRSIAERCFERGISTNVVNVVADLAIQRWSLLKSGSGEPSASLALQIKRRISKLKMNLKQSKDTDANAGETETHAFNQQQMISEMKKHSPSLSKLKEFLDATRATRIEKVNRMPALQILAEYPALKVPDLLLWEFTKIMNIGVDEMTERWKSFLDSIKEYLKKSQNFTPASQSYEGLTLEVLKKLPSIVPSGKKTKDNKKFVLQIYENNTAVNEIVPDTSDPPRLIGVGDVTKSPTLFCYLDGTEIFSEKCPIKAVLSLLATYWVFNIEFAAESRPAFQLISHSVLKEKVPRKKGKYSGAVDCLLQVLNL